MSEDPECLTERHVKILLVGDSGVGKSSICARYADDTFAKQYRATAGIDFFLKRTQLPNNRSLVIKLFDVAGASLRSNMLPNYCYGSDVVVMVYDVSKSDSFDNLSRWLEAVLKALIQENAPKRPIFALVANKIDLEHLRTVKSERHHRFASEHGLLTYAMSAKSGEGVSLCLHKLLAELVGVRLSKADQELQQTVVKADIVAYPRVHNNQVVPQQSNVNSVLCSIM